MIVIVFLFVLCRYVVLLVVVIVNVFSLLRHRSRGFFSGGFFVFSTGDSSLLFLALFFVQIFLFFSGRYFQQQVRDVFVTVHKSVEKSYLLERSDGDATECGGDRDQTDHGSVTAGEGG